MTTQLPLISEDTARAGTRLNGYDRTVSREDIATFVARTGESIDDYVVGGALVVPPGMLTGLYGPLIHGTFHYTAGVHVSSDLTFRRVPRAGEPLRIEGRVLELFEKNGNRYVTFSVEVSDADGDAIAEVVHTSIYALRARGS